MRARRVGTFTLGICLLGFGILFLIHLFIPSMGYLLIFHLWPIILISLGAETLFFVWKGSNEKIRYDGGAVLIILVLAIFAMGMAGMEWLMLHVPEEHLWLNL